MPTFKIDDREIPFEPGDTIITAAHRVGIDIPHYCWHPGLSVAANCRMCLVEVAPPPGRPALMLDVLRWDPDKQDYVAEKKPKLVPACQQAAAEGMQVKSEASQHVSRARAAVQELLLLNHPVDCPICDQAGECRLQDYWLNHQGTKKRMRDELVHKPKAVVFGPTIVYDAERCIICTRCVRFCEEVAKDPVLDVRERGNLNEIVVAPGRELDHDYTLMTEYVCPVGALTARDFRFKARVWFLRSARTVCVGCATGCNAFTDFDPRNQTVHRYRPRENPQVNKYWMCDYGMLDYQRIHHDRVLSARVGGEATPLATALGRAAEIIEQAGADKTALVLSAQHSNEDNYAALRLFRDQLGIQNVFISGAAPGKADDILIHADKNPNTNGVVDLTGTMPARRFGELVGALSEKRFTHVIALGSYASEPDRADALKGSATIIALATHEGPFVEHASVVLPVSSWAESDGTFVNAARMAQRSERAIRPRGDSLPAWRMVAELGRVLRRDVGYRKLAELRALMSPGGPEASGTVPSERAGAIG